MIQRQLDLVVLIDTTGSMGQYLDSAKRNIENIMETIRKNDVDLRVGIVEYKDHRNSKDSSYPLKKWEFMEKVQDVKNALSQLSAWGGGMDGPESVACAFDAAVELGFRELAAKVIVWIADAPPHGFDIPYDAYPDGCPCGIDFQKVVLKAVQQDIQVYSVACEPIRSIYKHFRDLMRAVSIVTGGQFVALVSANELADVIIGGSLEEVGMNLVVQKIEVDLENEDGFEQMTEDEKAKFMRTKIAEYCATHTMKQVTVKSIFKGDLPPIPKIYYSATTMEELRNVLKTREPSIYKFKEGLNLQEYNPCPQGFWDKTGRSEYNRKNRWNGGVQKEVKMELCDDDDFEEYDAELGEQKMIEEEEFTRENMVQIEETVVGETHQNKLLERLKKRMKK